jgi:hypothetical protein
MLKHVSLILVFLHVPLSGIIDFQQNLEELSYKRTVEDHLILMGSTIVFSYYSQFLLHLFNDYLTRTGLEIIFIELL